MKKLFTLLTLMVMGVCAYAATTTTPTTYVMKSYKEMVTTDDKGGTWTSSKAASTSNELPADITKTGANNRGVCFGKNVSNVKFTSGQSFSKVVKIEVECSSNSSTNSITATVGGESIGSTVNPGKNNHKTISFESETALTGVIELNITTSGSYYIGAITVITKEDEQGGDIEPQPEPGTVVINPSNGFEPVVINQPTQVTIAGAEGDVVKYIIVDSANRDEFDEADDEWYAAHATTYTEPITVDKFCAVFAWPNDDYSRMVMAQYGFVFAAPTITPAGGAVVGAPEVTISANCDYETLDGMIVYTLDGTDPLTSSTIEVYEAPFTPEGDNITVKAAIMGDDVDRYSSEVVEVTYTVVHPTMLVAAYNDKYYALTPDNGGVKNSLKAVEVNVHKNVVYFDETPDNKLLWLVSDAGIQNVDTKTYIASSNSTNLSMGDASIKWSWDNEKGTWTYKDGSTTRCALLKDDTANNKGLYFRAYSVKNINNTDNSGNIYGGAIAPMSYTVGVPPISLAAAKELENETVAQFAEATIVVMDLEGGVAIVTDGTSYAPVLIEEINELTEGDVLPDGWLGMTYSGLILATETEATDHVEVPELPEVAFSELSADCNLWDAFKVTQVNITEEDIVAKLTFNDEYARVLLRLCEGYDEMTPGVYDIKGIWIESEEFFEVAAPLFVALKAEAVEPIIETVSLAEAIEMAVEQGNEPTLVHDAAIVVKVAANGMIILHDGTGFAYAVVDDSDPMMSMLAAKLTENVVLKKGWTSTHVGQLLIINSFAIDNESDLAQPVLAEYKHGEHAASMKKWNYCKITGVEIYSGMPLTDELLIQDIECVLEDPYFEDGTYTITGFWMETSGISQGDDEGITLDPTYMFVATDFERTGDTTGIESIEAAGAAARYYNLQGVEVANPAKGNVYIRVIGNKATKVIVK